MDPPFCTQTSLILNLGKECVFSECVFLWETWFFCSFFSSSEVIINCRHGGFGFFGFFQSLAVHNPILFHIPGIISFCFLSKRKGSLQASWDKFGFSSRSKWSQLPKVPNVAADWKYHIRHGPTAESSQRSGFWVFSFKIVLFVEGGQIMR